MPKHTKLLTPFDIIGGGPQKVETQMRKYQPLLDALQQQSDIIELWQDNLEKMCATGLTWDVLVRNNHPLVASKTAVGRKVSDFLLSMNSDLAGFEANDIGTIFGQSMLSIFYDKIPEYEDQYEPKPK